MALTTCAFSIKGMHCESCTKLLTKAISSLPGVSQVDIGLDTGTATVAYDPAQTDMAAIFSAVEKSGYAAMSAGSPGPAHAFTIASLSGFLSRLFFDRSRLHMERGMLKTAALTFATLAVLEAVTYYAFFMGMPSFAAKNYGSYIFYLVLAVTLGGSSLWHLRAYRKRVSCQAGMMVGMTIGMLAGFLLGAIIGATNGMFVGATYGMLVGMAFGAYSGKCCGIMGIMEGLMAGLMGGLMGAMTTFMLLNENVLLFFPLLFSSSAVILMGLSYMVYRDFNNTAPGEHGPASLKSYSFPLFITFAFILTMVSTWLIVYGPRSALLQ